MAFEKCFYTYDVVVVKSLYITFLIHKEQFAFQVRALRITIKLDFWGILGGFIFSEIWFFSCIAHCVIKQLADRASEHYQERVCTCSYQKRER